MTSPPDESRARQLAGRDPRDTRWRDGWSVLVVIAICCLVEIVLSLGDRGIIAIPRLRQTVYEYAGFWPGLLRTWSPNYPGQPWLMFVTYGFLHGGASHLIFNMITLFSLGRPVVDRGGNRGFAAIFGSSILCGGLCFGLLTDGLQPMVGASGGLFGLAGALLAWNLIDRYSAALKLWPILLAVAGLVILNLFQWWLMHGLLAWQAHLGGFLGGAAVAPIFSFNKNR